MSRTKNSSNQIDWLSFYLVFCSKQKFYSFLKSISMNGLVNWWSYVCFISDSFFRGKKVIILLQLPTPHFVTSTLVIHCYNQRTDPECNLAAIYQPRKIIEPLIQTYNNSTGCMIKQTKHPNRVYNNPTFHQPFKTAKTRSLTFSYTLQKKRSHWMETGTGSWSAAPGVKSTVSDFFESDLGISISSWTHRCWGCDKRRHM